MGFEVQGECHIVELMDPLHYNSMETLVEAVELLFWDCSARLYLFLRIKSKRAHLLHTDQTTEKPEHCRHPRQHTTTVIASAPLPQGDQSILSPPTSHCWISGGILQRETEGPSFLQWQLTATPQGLLGGHCPLFTLLLGTELLHLYHNYTSHILHLYCTYTPLFLTTSRPCL